MKKGTLYAKRVKRRFGQLKQQCGKPDIPEPTSPVEQVILGILSSSASDSKALRAARALRETMVDLNEIRVSTDREVAAVIGLYLNNALTRASALRRALNAIFRKEHAVNLDRLHSLGRREARQYLEDLDGVDACAAASVMLWSLGGHAIPVDQRLFDAMRKEDLVAPSATVAEVQAFLERNINANDAKVFCLLMPKLTVKSAKSGGSANAGRARPGRTAAKIPTPRRPKIKKTVATRKASAPSRKRATSR